MQAIAKFFAEDVVGFFEDAVAAVGEWVRAQSCAQYHQIQAGQTLTLASSLLIAFQGKELLGAIVDFGTSVVNSIKDVFENGEVAELLNSDRLDAFGDDARNAITSLTDGKITLDDLKAVGKAFLDGVAIAVDFIRAGITDIINAVGAFFRDLGDFFASGFGKQKW